MRSSTAIGSSAAMIAVFDIVATVEAWRTGHIALGVVTLAAALVAVSVIVLARRPAVTLRSDLADWAARTSAATREPESRLIDRAVARHRADLDGLDAVDDESEAGDG